jgi:hypothetical protein
MNPMNPMSETTTVPRRRLVADGQVRPIVGWTIIGGTIAVLFGFALATYDGSNPVVEGLCTLAASGC